jgi:hypothetical protein
MPEDATPPQTQDGTESDMRNAALLVDERRREFLANLDPLTVNSYAVLYARFEKWIAYARRCHAAAVKREEKGADRWLQLEDRWEGGVRWLDRSLILSGSIRGRRAEQLVDVLMGAHDPPNVGSSQVVVPQIYQPAAQPKGKLWGR